MTETRSTDDWLFGDEADRRLISAKRLIGLLAALFAIGIGWAWFAELDEVASGGGRVVPTSREQVIQSLEGGILAKPMVRQDPTVTPGQVFSHPHPTQAGPPATKTTP